LAQLEEYRQQIRTISEDLNNKFAQQKAQMQAELAQKEVRIRGAIAQLMGGQNHHPLPEIASREIEVEQQASEIIFLNFFQILLYLNPALSEPSYSFITYSPLIFSPI
jgi:hypothetical protein